MDITYVKAVFGSLRKTRTQPVYRDDHDLILQLVGVKGLPVHFQAHFANSEYGTAVVMMGSDGEVSIPNTLLATGLPVYCWILVEQGISGAVRYSIQIPVRQKARPDGTITPEQADIISQAISALNDAGANAQEAADSAAQSAEYVAGVKDDLYDAIDRVGVLEEAKETTLEAAGNAEAWAVGNRGGSAVPSTDPTYHNNAKYYAEQAAESARTLTIDSTLTQAGQAADAKAVGDKIQQTKSDLNNSAGSLLYSQYASGTSGLMPFRVKNGDTITVKRTDDSVFENVQLRFYDFNRNLVNHLTLLSNHGTSRTATVNLSSECFYIGITVVTEETPKTYVIVNKSNEYYQKQEALKQEDAKIHEAISELSDIAVHKNLINRFNPSTVHEGRYIVAVTGEDAVNSDFFASDYIYIGDLDRVTVSYTHIFGWYDADKNWLGHPDSMASRSADKVYDKPADAVYMRFSTYNSDLNVAQIGESVDRASYVQYGEFTISGFVAQKNQIIVDASGNGDYTSFTEALYENVNSGVDVIVKAGTYNIVDEYIALFGQEAVDNMADSDSAIFNGFQYGVKITNRKVEFASGAHLVCDWTGHTVDGTHRFSALAVGMNAEIIGLDLDCTATFYAIHDDYGDATNEYTNIYRFCRVIGHSMTNVNCIGGGCKPHSRHIIDNCYFDNNTSSSTAVRFHNTNATGAEPEIYVSNSFFNTYFRANWYGNQTSKMRVYVNNCYAKAIHKGQESSRYTTDNVELYKWNNTETNPVE